ncbi:cysteine desulfurase [Streptococcus suis]|nr:cysteine desulfurase [Streptococcus suis]
MIYLDNAATTALSPTALETLMTVSKDTFGNPSSIHGVGRKANQILRQARQDIASHLQIQPDQLIFTSGGSEANNLALQGYALANQDKGKHLITTAIEHHSVLDTMGYLEQRFGFEVTYLQPQNQVITAQQVQDALRPDTILVSMMYANNETGALLPIYETGKILQNHQALFHVDAVQVMGKLAITPELLGIDFLSASAHKFHGPKGIGFLYSRIAKFDSLIHGGKQENHHRAGTENLASIAAMAVALKEQENQQTQSYQTIMELKNNFLSRIDGLTYYLNQTNQQLPHIINIGFPGQLNEQLLMRLDLSGIAVSSGSACTAGVVQTSHVLEAMYGKDSPRLRESIRISLSDTTPQQDLVTLADTLKRLLEAPTHGI